LGYATGGKAGSEFTANLSREAYIESVLIQSAVERQLEIIGEAARRVSEAFQQKHPEIPWRSIIGQRNVLAHQYGRSSKNGSGR
jgi:uncharacterized protein with HEPN domain